MARCAGWAKAGWAMARGGGLVWAGLGGLLAPGAPALANVDLSSLSLGVGDGFTINGQFNQDRSGLSSSAAGDVNGDGVGDVIVGAHAYTPSSPEEGLGRAFVVFGRTGPTPVELSAVAAGVGGFVLHGPQEADWTGYSVSGAGDVNGDGLADVIVGAPKSDPLSGTDAGRSYVVFGKTSTTAVSLGAMGAGGFVINGLAGNERSGWSVAAAGDVNGDGRGDVIIGAPYASPVAGATAGRSYVVHGRTGGLEVNLSSVANGTGGFVINGQAAGENAGRAVASAGDFNGDGLGDVILGAPFADPTVNPAGINGGRAYVVYGKTNTTAVQLSAVAITQGGFMMNGQAAGDTAGQSVACVGDVNGDGLGDLVVGAYLATTNAGSQAGRAYVVFSRPVASPVQLSNVAAGSDGFLIEGSMASDRAGRRAGAAGDVNGDGLADLILGSNSVGNTGRAHVVLGRTSTSPVAISSIEAGIGGFMIDGHAAGDSAGASVSSAGDANGDGLADLLVGAPGARPSASSFSVGRGYVVSSPYAHAPLAPATSGQYSARLAIGNIDVQGIGTNSLGDDRTVFPNSRAWVDFDGGTASSFVWATVTRHNAGLAGIPATQVAGVQWMVVSDREGWGSMAITLRYTNAEIAGLNEAALVLYSAPSATGPFTPAANPTANAARNEIGGTVTSLPRVFAIAIPDNTAPTATIARLDQSPSGADVVDFLVTFSEPVAPTFSAADVTFNGTLGATSSLLEIIPADPQYVVRVLAQPLDANGSVGITVGTAVTDKAGNPKAAANASSLYQMQRTGGASGLAGDVNKDGAVNVADVTLLSNFIVNGAPPLP